MDVIVLRCKCVHEFQDLRYGRGMRLHNVTLKGDQATCTVCGSKSSVNKSK